MKISGEPRLVREGKEIIKKGKTPLLFPDQAVVNFELLNYFKECSWVGKKGNLLKDAGHTDIATEEQKTGKQAMRKKSYCTDAKEKC